jgi:HK97 family phage major capsid protein
LANTSNTSKKYVQWAEQTGVEGAPDATDEGADKAQIDFDWTEKSAEVVKYTAFIKISKEMLDDVDGIQAEVDAELLERVMLDIDADLLAGNGTAPILNGILNQDTAYSAGSFAGTIFEPNKSDVLRTAIAQVVAAEFMPNYVLMHPNDIASMDLEKGNDGHYVMAPFKSADGTVISGVKILGNTGQTVDKFTVGDFTKLNIKVREGFGIDVGHDGDDFKKNLLTILGEMRLVSYIKANHATAFVSGDFSDAIAALATS